MIELLRSPTRQDTVVAIQALAAIAVVVKADAINLTVQVSSSTMRGVSLFRITSTNFQLYHSKEVVTALRRPGRLPLSLLSCPVCSGELGSSSPLGFIYSFFI